LNLCHLENDNGQELQMYVFIKKLTASGFFEDVASSHRPVSPTSLFITVLAFHFTSKRRLSDSIVKQLATIEHLLNGYKSTNVTKQKEL
jgi:hypothetical protein